MGYKPHVERDLEGIAGEGSIFTPFKRYRTVTVGDGEEGVMVVFPEDSPFYESKIGDVTVHFGADRANPFQSDRYERAVRTRKLFVGMRLLAPLVILGFFYILCIGVEK